MNKRTIFVVGCVVLLLAGCGVQVSANNDRAGEPQVSAQQVNVKENQGSQLNAAAAPSFSGDDAYDPASVKQSDETLKSEETNLIFPLPGMDRQIAPVFDSSGDVVSDPTGTLSNGSYASDLPVPVTEVKIAPMFDSSGAIVSDPTGTLSNGFYSGDDAYDPAIVNQPAGRSRKGG